MLYVKNVPGWERVLRLVLGAGALVFTAMSWRSSSLAAGLALAGAMVAVTGLVGFCPMCALVGRRLDQGR